MIDATYKDDIYDPMDYNPKQPLEPWPLPLGKWEPIEQGDLTWWGRFIESLPSV